MREAKRKLMSPSPDGIDMRNVSPLPQTEHSSLVTLITEFAKEMKSEKGIFIKSITKSYSMKTFTENFTTELQFFFFFFFVTVKYHNYKQCFSKTTKTNDINKYLQPVSVKSLWPPF